MKSMPVPAAVAAIVVAVLVAGGGGFAAGYRQGVGKGGEVIATLSEGNDVNQAFRQARAALVDIDAAAGAPPPGARMQLAMALESLGGIALARGPSATCSAAHRDTLQAMSRHLRAHPLPEGSPGALFVPHALKYCG